MSRAHFLLVGGSALIASCSSEDDLFSEATGSAAAGSSSAGAASGTGGSGGGTGLGASGSCTADAECAALSVGCHEGQCLEGQCVQGLAADGRSCDDGLFCTGSDACLAGVCEGGPPDCPTDGALCHVPTCDEDRDLCGIAVAPDGSRCDEANRCTGGTCSSGMCVSGPPPDCSALTSACTLGECDPQNGCVAVPASDGSPCTDGDSCSTSDACQAGVCAPQATITICSNGDGCCPANCPVDNDCQPFDQPSYMPTLSWSQVVQINPFGIAWDGTNYWCGGGSGAAGENVWSYDAQGNFVTSYNQPQSLRSWFTKGSPATIYGRYQGESTLQAMTAPGLLTPTITLSGMLAPFAEQHVVWDHVLQQYVGHWQTSIQKWDDNGNLVGTVALVGFGTVGNENSAGGEGALAVTDSFWLTYWGQTLSAWDRNGNRVGTTTLVSAGNSPPAYDTFSYTNGLVWVSDGQFGPWRAYDVGL